MPKLTNSYGNQDVDPSARLALEQVRRQTNRSPNLLQSRNGAQNKAPAKMSRGDLASSLVPRGCMFTLAGDKNTRRSIIVPDDIIQNLGTQFGTGVPTIANFPTENDYGWWIDTAAGKAYWSINVTGTIYYTTSTIGGINFTDISGTITDAQHGNLGRQTGGSPHHTNATTAQPGFLSTTFFDRLNTATSAATASTLALRNASGEANFAGTCGFVAMTLSGAFNGNSISLSAGIGCSQVDVTGAYYTQGVQVVSVQQTGFATQTASGSGADLGASPTTSDIASYLSFLDQALKTHGLLGT